jgi:hypothetical protein
MRLLRAALVVVWASVVGGVRAPPAGQLKAAPREGEQLLRSVTSAYVRGPASTTLPMTHERLREATQNGLESNVPEQVHRPP